MQVATCSSAEPRAGPKELLLGEEEAAEHFVPRLWWQWSDILLCLVRHFLAAPLQVFITFVVKRHAGAAKR